MAKELADNTRKLLWQLMVDRELAETARQQGIGYAAERAGIELSEDELASVERVDLDDLGDLLHSVERDLTLVMGGSRPRRAVALSDGAIRELRDALDDIRRIDRSSME